MKSPAFQFYPHDFVGSGTVGTMSPEEVGVYVLLLCLDWNQDGFAYEPTELARYCRCTPKLITRAWPKVSRGFALSEDGLYRNPRLQREREKQKVWREKSSKGGKKSGETRKGGSRVVQPPFEGSLNTPFPSPSPTPSKNKKTLPAADAEAPKDSPPSESPAPPPSAPRSWVAEAVEIWTARVGSIPPGRMGRALKAAVDKHGWPVVRHALDDYIAVEDGKLRKPEYFAASIVHWIESSNTPLVDETGVLTLKGERLARRAS